MNKHRILVVEDDDLMQGMLNDSLSTEEYDVTLASDGLEGLKNIQKTKFDLVLLDIKLPKMNGITLLEKIKKTSAETIVIIMTAFGTVETAVQAMKMGAFDYITKPFLIDELMMIMKKGLELQQLKRENILLRKELQHQYYLGDIIGKSIEMQKIFQLIKIIAPSKSTVLIQGASGTGKELIAKAIHQLSLQKDRPLIKVSCGALPETLIESELFGHEKGAFTNALKLKKGRFELAHQSTIFLDEVDDMKPMIQMRLLRILQERELERVGGTDTIKVDLRIIAASKVDLLTLVNEGKFREDLYYRLNVVPIILPPLHARKGDIPLLVNHFLSNYNTILNKNVELSTEALQRMMNYNWPGNIRELENLIERLVTLSVNNKITTKDLPENLKTNKKWSSDKIKIVVQEVEKEHILKILEQTNWIKKETAKILGITTKSLWEKINKYNIS
ncbi:MAG: sigma-54-dependent Fis family transcriptional regulator [Candidatus Cloacimonetes bacterium]|nr:sigma-54-dependent Fis family transcriptional regulator [Candidatus Cloacimonadota bacterium]